MKIEYRRLTENELDTFINMRINQLREEGAKEDIDLVPALKGYYTRHILDAQVEESGCSPVCLPTLIIEERELQRNCYPVL